jgi:hypothetical protein
MYRTRSFCRSVITQTVTKGYFIDDYAVLLCTDLERLCRVVTGCVKNRREKDKWVVITHKSDIPLPLETKTWGSKGQDRKVLLEISTGRLSLDKV